MSLFLDAKEQLQLKQALKQVAGYLSRRSYSKEELQFKLSRQFSSEIIQRVLDKAQKNRWIESPEQLSKKVLENLHHKNKGWNYIKAHLTKRHLPIPAYNRQMELQKARNIILRKLKNNSVNLYHQSEAKYSVAHQTDFSQELSFDKKNKLKRFLIHRGFEVSIIQELFDKD